MSDDLISREALKENIINICGKCSNIITKYENSIPDGNCAIQHIMNIIDNAPTVSQINIFCENADEKTIEELKAEMQKAQLAVFDERPQGVWEIGYTAKQKKIAVCNLCNCISFQGKTNFCHNCGAKMQKGGAE